MMMLSDTDKRILVLFVINYKADAAGDGRPDSRWTVEPQVM